MIICSCALVTDRDIHQAIDWMRNADPYTLITPGRIYRVLGKRPECGACIRLFVDQMRCNDKLGVPAELRDLRHRARIAAADEG